MTIRLSRTTWDTSPGTTRRARGGDGNRSRASPEAGAELVPLQDALHVVQEGYSRRGSLRRFRVPRLVRDPHEIGPQISKPDRQGLGTQLAADRVGDGGVRPFNVAHQGQWILALIHRDG